MKTFGPVIHRCFSSRCSDETQFRNCIVWLEDQKIRHYKIEDRGNLRNIPSSDWPKAYQKVRPPETARQDQNTTQKSVEIIIQVMVILKLLIIINWVCFKFLKTSLSGRQGSYWDTGNEEEQKHIKKALKTCGYPNCAFVKSRKRSKRSTSTWTEERRTALSSLVFLRTVSVHFKPSNTLETGLMYVQFSAVNNVQRHQTTAPQTHDRSQKSQVLRTEQQSICI